MYIKEQSKQKVSVGMDLHEAQRLLEALKEKEEQIDAAEDLIELMEEAGVAAPTPPDHTRYEYIPPRDMRGGSNRE